MIKSLCWLGAAAASALLTLVVTTHAESLNRLDSGDSNWTQKWTKAYGCSIDTKLADHPVLRQTLPPEFTKGNHAWSCKVAVTAGTRYRFRVQYQLSDVKEALAQFHFAFSDGTMMDWLNFRESSAKLSGSETQWRELVHEFTAPANSASMRLSLRLNSPGTVYWDSPILEVASPPTGVTFEEDAQSYDLRDSVGLVVREIPPEKISSLHVKWLRYNINWASVEPDKSNGWNETALSKAVAQVSAAKEAGANVMVSLGYSPRWAARKSAGVSAGSLVAKDLRDWQKFVAVIVARLGDRCDCYRIMNEVNHQWDTGSQPQEYAEFLKTAYTTIKAARPTATVVMAGASGTPGGFLQGILDAGAGKSFDVAACQPYVGGRNTPEDGRLTERLQAYRMVLAAQGFSQPIWATEFGYPSEPLDRITPLEQAGLYVRSHLLAISSGAGVTKFFFYLLRDEKGDTISQTGGLYTADWKLKPLGEAVATLAKVINPAKRYVGHIDIGKDPSLYNRLFETGEGEWVWAIWRTTGTSTLSLQFEGPVKKTAWNGESGPAATSFQVTLNNLPVYFTGKMPQIASRAVKSKSIGFEAVAAKDRDTLVVPWKPGPPDWSKATALDLKAKRNPETGIVAKARLAASPEGLSVQVDIEDDSPALNQAPAFAGAWVQDSVELYLNLSPEQAPAGFVTNDCYHFLVTPGIRGKGARLYWADQGSRAVRKVIDSAPVDVILHPDGKGYTLAFHIEWKEWTTRAPKAGDTLGFDIIATRSNTKGEREETGVWYGNLEDGTDASLWGVIRLESGKKTQ